MWEKVTLLFKIKDLRNKILFVFGMLVVFRILANIPIPGIDITGLRALFAGNQVLGLLNIFSGGGMENLSIAMLGLGPYITATIVMQLLTMIFPKLEAMYKEEGEAGRQKFNQYSRLLTVPFSIIQAYSMLALFKSQQVLGNITTIQMAISVITITAGAVFLMWIGEIISEKGIGNGISLLIFAGIVSRTPVYIKQVITTWTPAMIPSYVAFFVAAIIIIFGVVLVTEARRNIPVSYAKRVRGRKMFGGVSTYLPMNVNPAGVIPIIFALAILLFPGMIANFLSAAGNPTVVSVAKSVADFFNNTWIHGAFYFVLVVLFTYFYTAVTFDPKNVAENLQKMGGFIPGIRPGKPTSDFIRYILNRVLLIGGVFLGLIAVLPSIIQGMTGVEVFSFAIGGTSLLIVVSVVLETKRQIESQLTMRDYEKF